MALHEDARYQGSWVSPHVQGRLSGCCAVSQTGIAGIWLLLAVHW